MKKRKMMKREKNQENKKKKGKPLVVRRRCSGRLCHDTDHNDALLLKHALAWAQVISRVPASGRSVVVAVVRVGIGAKEARVRRRVMKVAKRGMWRSACGNRVGKRDRWRARLCSEMG